MKKPNPQGESKPGTASAADKVLILHSRVDSTDFMLTRSFNCREPSIPYTADWSVDGRTTLCYEFNKNHWTELSWLRERLKPHHLKETVKDNRSPAFFDVGWNMEDEIPGFPMEQLSMKQFDLLKVITDTRVKLREHIKNLNERQQVALYKRLGLQEGQQIEMDFLLGEEKEFYDTIASANQDEIDRIVSDLPSAADSLEPPVRLDNLPG